MFSSKLTRVANRATNITTATPAPAQWTASQCFATSTQRRPHQRRQSSSKASCPPDSSNKAAKAAENVSQPSEVEKTPRRASRVKRTQVDKSAKGKEEADQFAGLPAVPDTRHVGEKGMWLTRDTRRSHTDIFARLLALNFLQLTSPALSGQPYSPTCLRGDIQQHIRVEPSVGRLGKWKLCGEATRRCDHCAARDDRESGGQQQRFTGRGWSTMGGSSRKLEQRCQALGRPA